MSAAPDLSTQQDDWQHDGEMGPLQRPVLGVAAAHSPAGQQGIGHRADREQQQRRAIVVLQHMRQADAQRDGEQVRQQEHSACKQRQQQQLHRQRTHQPLQNHAHLAAEYVVEHSKCLLRRIAA